MTLVEFRSMDGLELFLASLNRSQNCFRDGPLFLSGGGGGGGGGLPFS